LLRKMHTSAGGHDGDGRDGHFEAEQNALVVRNAERYYRTMVHGGPESWNVRDRHMAETLGRLLDHHGPGAKAIVWEHNTHIGDGLLIFDGRREGPLAEPRGHRAIGVVYHPEYEQFGNYVPTVLPARYDAFLYIDETEALRPLHMPAQVDREAPETYPSGV